MIEHDAARAVEELIESGLDELRNEVARCELQFMEGVGQREIDAARLRLERAEAALPALLSRLAEAEGLLRRSHGALSEWVNHTRKPAYAGLRKDIASFLAARDATEEQR